MDPNSAQSIGLTAYQKGFVRFYYITRDPLHRPLRHALETVRITSGGKSSALWLKAVLFDRHSPSPLALYLS